MAKEYKLTPEGLVIEELSQEYINGILEYENNVIKPAKIAEEQAKAQKEADALAGNNKLLALGLSQAEVTAMTGYTPPSEV